MDNFGITISGEDILHPNYILLTCEIVKGLPKANICITTKYSEEELRAYRRHSSALRQVMNSANVTIIPGTGADEF